MSNWLIEVSNFLLVAIRLEPNVSPERLFIPVPACAPSIGGRQVREDSALSVRAKDADREEHALGEKKEKRGEKAGDSNETTLFLNASGVSATIPRRAHRRQPRRWHHRAVPPTTAAAAAVRHPLL